MKLIGKLLMWVGFLSGALATVMHPPSEGVDYAKDMKQVTYDKEGVEIDRIQVALPDLSDAPSVENGWHLIPWTWYGISVAICLFGVVVIRAGIKSDRIETEAAGIDINALNTALAAAIKATVSVRKALLTLPPSKVVNEIDDHVTDHLREFADGREAIASKFGLAAFADVMTDFAAGERSINRAWSASADGYFDEADDCLRRGEQLLQSALSRLQSLERGNTGGAR